MPQNIPAPTIRVLDERNEESASSANEIVQNGHKKLSRYYCQQPAEDGNKLSTNRHKKIRKISMSVPPEFSRPPSESEYSIRSASNKAKILKDKASELIVRISARQLKRIAKTQRIRIGSLQRETQHFLGVTSVNGLLRIYRSRGFFRFCWITVTSISLLLLFWQIANTIQLYFSRPTVSQVSFLLPGNGLQFPTVTICSHNPIRKKYLEDLNKTSQISKGLLQYIMMSFMDVQYLLSSINDTDQLDSQDQEWKALSRVEGPKFTVSRFFWNASQSCTQMLKLCTFGGKEFDCCTYAIGILTDIGKCYQLDLSGSNQPWLRRQVQAGINNGLQVIVDAHTEQQISSLELASAGRPFADNFETGFRYYVHEQHSMPYLSTEGISVSPGTKVYSAVSPTNYILLPEDMWGNCTDQWPDELVDIAKDGGVPQEKYSSVKCKTLCHAKYFNDLCGCSPFIYNIEAYFPVCTPYETYMCLNSTVLNGTGLDVHNFSSSDTLFHQLIPGCPDCKIECERWVYHTYNSYVQGFSRNSMNWLRNKNPEWSPGHVRSNFVSINIFYRDMVYTEYKQVQSISKTQILSDIGGNMGLFLGMSVISLIEFFTFICKITWLFVSKKRRQHMLAKKQKDEERERQLQATLEMAREQRKYVLGTLGIMSEHGHGHHCCHGQEQPQEGGESDEGTLGMIRRRIAGSIRRRKSGRMGPIAVDAFDTIIPNLRQPDLEIGIAHFDIDDPALLTHRKRSNSVIPALVSRRNSCALSPEELWNTRKQSSVNNNNSNRRHDFVESIIENRLHGDAARATRRASSLSSWSSSSTTEDDEEGVEGQQKQQVGAVAETIGTGHSKKEEAEDEDKDKLVELKIDLNANTVKLIGPSARANRGSGLKRRRHFSTAFRAARAPRRASICMMMQVSGNNASSSSSSATRCVNRSLSEQQRQRQRREWEDHNRNNQ